MEIARARAEATSDVLVAQQAAATATGHPAVERRETDIGGAKKRTVRP